MSNFFENKQNDYSHKRQDVKPSYRFSKITPQTGSSSLTITAGYPETVFELPTRCMNLSRTHLKALATLSNSGGTHFNWAYADLVAPIDQISLYSRGGVFLCDIPNAAQYTKIALKTYSVDELPYNSREACPFGGLSETIPSLNPRHNNTNSSAICEPKYFNHGSTVDVAMELNLDIPLKAFKDSILALDKDLFFNEVLILKIRWNPLLKWGGEATAITNANTGILPLTGVALTKLYLYVALEENPLICAGLQQKVMTSGLSLNVPYVYTYKHVPGTSGNGAELQNVNIRLNGAMGQYCKRILHAMFPAVETATFGNFNIDNTDKARFLYYHTSIDNARRQEFNVLVADGDDWDLIKPVLKNTPIDSPDAYRYNWFIADDFDVLEQKQTDDIATGLSLATEHTWNVSVACDRHSATDATRAYNHYTFVIVSRTLMITPQGIMIQ